MARRKRWKQSRNPASTAPVRPAAADEAPADVMQTDWTEALPPNSQRPEANAHEPATRPDAAAAEPTAVIGPETAAASTSAEPVEDAPASDTHDDAGEDRDDATDEGAGEDTREGAGEDTDDATDKDGTETGVAQVPDSEAPPAPEAEAVQPEPDRTSLEADSEREQPEDEGAYTDVEVVGAPAHPLSDDAAAGESSAAAAAFPDAYPMAEAAVSDGQPAAEAPGSDGKPGAEEGEPREAGLAAYDLTTSAAGRTPAAPVEGVAAWKRLLLLGRPRATKANMLGAVLAIALGIGIATQVQLTNERGLSELSQTDLVRVLDDISLRSSQLDEHIRELEATRDRLRSGTDTTAEAMDQAQRRLDTLGILAGTIAAQGPGITVDISDPDRQVTGPLILDLIQELRDAGAESIEVGGVRVVASTFIGDAGGDLSVDGSPITRPIHIKAIGDSNTLASAMTIPGGIVETIRQKGARASVNEAPSIEITSVHKPKPLTHARPSD